MANLSAPFIRRPVATSLLAAALFLAGAAAFTHLPVAPLPRVDYPTINVHADLPGASPNTMATSVAMPLERRFGRIAGVTEITSENALGTTSITVQFDLDRDVDACARDIQAAINAAGADLPPNLPQVPRYRKVNPADSPILILALHSKTLPLPQVFEAANTVLAQKIAQVPGVGQVGVGGGVQPAVRVDVDPVKLASLGLGLEEVRRTLATATANQPKGGIGADTWHQIGVDDQLLDADAWRNVVVHWSTPGEQVAPAIPASQTVIVNAGAPATAAPPGTGAAAVGLAAPLIGGRGDQETGSAAPLSPAAAASGAAAVRLGDIATVTDSVEDNRVAGWFDGQRTVIVVIRRQPGANILQVIDRIEAMLPQLMRSISPAIDVSIAHDRAVTIRASVHDIEFSLCVSIALVVLVVFVFLRSARATAIPSVAVPLSLIATFGVMYLLGYSIDNLSLMALTIATGFVVDDAIVVTENIARHVELGARPMRAALDGARQIGFTILSITASLLAVFIPILFMGGPYGLLFREFAVTLAVAVAISALLSLTLTPMMCSRLLRDQREPGGLGRALDRGLAGLIAGYGRALRFVLRHRVGMGLATLAVIGATVVLYMKIPLGLFPQQDTGFLVGQSVGPQDISFPSMKARQQQLFQIVMKDPDVAHVVGSVGGFGAKTVNQGSFFISLKEKPERKASAEQIINRLRPKLSHVPGIRLFLQSSQDVRIGGHLSRTEYQYTLEDANFDELEAWAPRVTAALRQLSQLKDVSADLQTQGLQLDIDVDRATAARFGITEAMIDNTLYDAFGQRQIAVFYTEVNQYRVVLEADPEIGTGPDALAKLYVTSASGAQVPLSTLVRVRRSHVALSIDHQGQFPATVVSFNLAPGVALGDAVAALNGAIAKIGMPASVHGAFAGTANAFQSSVSTMRDLVIIALLAVYIVLGVLYESYIHPLTIMSSLVPAGLGALLALLLFGSDLNLIAMVGIILLIGIVMKNAILMIDFALEQERAGKAPADAIYEACLLRFRPILMTTLAAMFGALPLALGRGTGSELRQPLGIAIVGGLAVSQLLTLFTTPVVYLALHRFTRKRGGATALPP